MKEWLCGVFCEKRNTFATPAPVRPREDVADVTGRGSLHYKDNSRHRVLYKATFAARQRSGAERPGWLRGCFAASVLVYKISAEGC